jgi:putative heme-binding domain-containing protein
VRRYAAEGTKPAYEACTRLLTATPPDQTDAVLVALSQGLSERSRSFHGLGQGGLFQAVAGVDTNKPKEMPRRFEPLTPALKDFLTAAWREKADDAQRIRLALQAGNAAAYQHLLALLAGHRSSRDARRAQLAVLEELGTEDCVPVVLKLLDEKQTDELRAAALNVLARFATREIIEKVLALYPTMSPALRAKARDLLFSRPASTRAFLELVDAKKVAAEEVPVDQLRRIALHGDKDLDALVRKHWGNIQPGTPEEKLAVMRRLSNDLRAGEGDRKRGKELFTKHCGTCHRLFGEGQTVGPDLTTASRGDRDWLLASIVDPSAVIRSQYLNYIAVTAGGTVLTGIIAEQDAASITLLDAKNQRTKIARDKIEELKEASTSLMPDNLLDPLTPQELRDLFSYLQSSGK